MAISALKIYAEAQNGRSEVTVLQQGQEGVADGPVPEWLAQPPHETAAATPTIPSPVLSPPPTPVGTKKPIQVSLNQLVRRFGDESNHLAASTREKFRHHFKVAADYLNFERGVGTITLADLRQLKSQLSVGRKPSTVNDILFKAMTALFRIAVEDEIISTSPLEKLKRARKGEPDRQQPTWQQARQIEVEVSRYAAETAIIVGFMRNFGVGQAEIMYLEGEHVDVEQAVIHFRRKKTGKPFDVPIFPHAKEFIARLKDQGRFQIGSLVIRWRNPRKALATACERLGLPTYEPRALRRCFIVHCLQLGMDPRLVAKWQGHRDAKLIFSVYGKHIDKDYERAQAEKLGVSL